MPRYKYPLDDSTLIPVERPVTKGIRMRKIPPVDLQGYAYRGAGRSEKDVITSEEVNYPETYDGQLVAMFHHEPSDSILVRLFTPLERELDRFFIFQPEHDSPAEGSTIKKGQFTVTTKRPAPKGSKSKGTPGRKPSGPLVFGKYPMTQFTVWIGTVIAGLIPERSPARVTAAMELLKEGGIDLAAFDKTIKVPIRTFLADRVWHGVATATGVGKPFLKPCAVTKTDAKKYTAALRRYVKAALAEVEAERKEKAAKAAVARKAKAAKKAPAKKAAKKSPTKKTARKAPAKRPAKKAAARKTARKAPAKKTAKRTAKKTARKAPAKK